MIGAGHRLCEEESGQQGTVDDHEGKRHDREPGDDGPQVDSRPEGRKTSSREHARDNKDLLWTCNANTIIFIGKSVGLGWVERYSFFCGQSTSGSRRGVSISGGEDNNRQEKQVLCTTACNMQYALCIKRVQSGWTTKSE